MAIKAGKMNLSSGVRKREKCKTSRNMSLRVRMINQLNSARFRYINEQMYTSAGNNSVETFTEEADNFEAYHKGFRQQVKQWPINPLDIIIKSIRKRSDLSELVVADFGCGEARLSAEISSMAKKVVSFDLMAANSRVKVCDVRNTPLPSKSVDILVYCLSLMASSLTEHFKEANRVLKIGGTMKIAEVESRFVNVDRFIEDIKHFGFELQTKNFSYNLFFFMDFKKISDISKSKKKKLPDVSLLPCIYKKR